MTPERIAELRMRATWEDMPARCVWDEMLDEIERLRSEIINAHTLDDEDGTQWWWWCRCGVAYYDVPGFKHRAHVDAILSGGAA